MDSSEEPKLQAAIYQYLVKKNYKKCSLAFLKETGKDEADMQSTDNIAEIYRVRPNNKGLESNELAGSDSESDSSSSSAESVSSGNDSDDDGDRATGNRNHVTVVNTAEKHVEVGDDDSTSSSSGSSSSSSSSSSSGDSNNRSNNKQPVKPLSVVPSTKSPLTSGGGNSDNASCEDSGSSSDDDDDNNSSSSGSNSSENDSDSSSSKADSSSSSSSDDEEEDANKHVQNRHETAKRKAEEAHKAAENWMQKTSPMPGPSTKSKKQKYSSSSSSTAAGTSPAAGESFKRVDAEVWNQHVKTELADNSYVKTFGEDGFGAKANKVLSTVRGKDFRHEKTKRKRGTYRGGAITLASNSFKYDN